MTRSADIKHRGSTRHLALGLILGGLAVLLATLVLLLPALERIYLGQLGKREASTLTLAVEGLTGSLRRFEALPGLIAERPDLARALRDPSDTALIDRVNDELHLTAEEVGLSDIFLIDPTGLTIAASNHWKALSFVGQNFAYRPYFTGALAGERGRFFALGTTSGEGGRGGHPNIRVRPLRLDLVFLDPAELVLSVVRCLHGSVIFLFFIVLQLGRIGQRSSNHNAHIERPYCCKVLPVPPRHVLGLDRLSDPLHGFALGQHLQGRLGLIGHGLADGRQLLRRVRRGCR